MNEPITAYLYVCDTMADWEAAYAIAELNSCRFFKKDARRYVVKTVGSSNKSVVTMGGVHILPDITVDECHVENAGILILPGGETWLDVCHSPIIEKAREFLDAGLTVAAICGATMALANAGFLDNRPHTSNDLGYLKEVCLQYRGEAFYQNKPVVSDGSFITASGIAPLEFAYEILRQLDVFSPQTLDAWYKLNTTKEAAYFYALMQSLQAAQ